MAGTTYCTSCGTHLPSHAKFCGSCGARVIQPMTDAPESAPSGPTNMTSATVPPRDRSSALSGITKPPPPNRLVGPPAPSGSGRTVRVGGVPLPAELALVIAMLWLSALLLIVPSLNLLPDAIGILDEGVPGRALGTLLLMAIVILIFAAAAYIGLGVLLLRADRVGRILTVAVSAALVIDILDADSKGADEIVVLLCSIAAIAILTTSPNVRAFLTGPESRQYAQPPVVAAARSLMLYMGWALEIVGALSLLVGDFDSKFYLIGIGLIALSVAVYGASRRLTSPDAAARNLSTALMGGCALLLVLSTGDATNMLLPLALLVAVVVLLWVPDSSRSYFKAARS